MAFEPEDFLKPFEHVQDANSFHLSDSLFGKPVHLDLPPINFFGLYKFQLTKFMVLELVAAGLILAIFIPLASRARDGNLPTGRWWNGFESLLTFIRDQVARPAIGAHDADKYVPFLWTTFLFILVCNLLGMVPWMGSPTASIWVTGALAVVSFFMMHGSPIRKMGVVHHFKSLW